MRSAGRDARAFLTSFFVFLLVSLALAAKPAHATSFQPVNPDELKMRSEPNAPGAAAVILYRQVDRDDNGRTSHEDNYLRIKILTEEGRKYANVEIPYDTASSAISNLRARTIRPDGSIANFEGRAYTNTIAKARGVKYEAKTFTLPDVQVGSIIEYHYTVDFQEYWIFSSHWVVSQELFTRQASFSLKRYQGDENFTLRWVWTWLPGDKKPEKVNDSLIRLTVSNIPAFVVEDYMPPRSEMESRVDFVYEEHYLPNQTEDYWKEIAKERYGRMQSFTGKNKAMAEALSQIVSPGDSSEVKLHKIYDKVQSLRNTDYEDEKTEEERKRAKEKTINNVEDVWKKGYGDRTDLAWLFLALVRSAGIEAYGCWVSDRENFFFDPRSMQSRKLDVAVVLVKLNGQEIFFNPGNPYNSYGMLTWYETGVVALKLDKGGSSWIKTPLPAAAESLIERKADLKLDSHGSLEGTLRVTYTGMEASSRRTSERRADAVARKKYIEDDVKSMVPVGIDLELTNSPDWTHSGPPLVAEFKLKVPGWAQGSGRRVILPSGLFAQNEKHLFDNQHRVHPIYFEFASLKKDDITISLPPGWKVTSLYKPFVDEDKRVIGYTNSATYENGKLHLQRKVKLDMQMLDLKFYDALRQFYGWIKSGDEDSVLLEPGVQLVED